MNLPVVASQADAQLAVLSLVGLVVLEVLVLFPSSLCLQTHNNYYY
jgi:hypothetical protein